MVRAMCRTPVVQRFALGMLLCWAGLVAGQPVPMRGLAFTDHHGKPLDAAVLRARPTLLHFVFTSCSSVCPTQVQELAAMQRALPPDAQAQLAIVSMTVDPLQDTPEALAAFARRQSADRPGWYFTTGLPAQVHALIERMQALAPTDPRPDNHGTRLYLYDARGVLVQRYAGVPLDRTRLVAEITQITRGKHP